MTNTPQLDADLTATLHEMNAPLREMIDLLFKMQVTFGQEREFILQHYPKEDIGEFPPLNDIQGLNYRDLDVRKVFCELALRRVERRARDVQAEVDEAERNRAEQNMTEEQAWRKSVDRAIAYLAAEITKLKGVHLGRLPALPHVARENVPQLLGQPGGMGRPAAMGPGGNGGARKLGSSVSALAPETAWANANVNRGQHPLEVIGGSGRRG